MRLIPLLLAALVCACDTSSDAREAGADAPPAADATPSTPGDSASAAPADSVPHAAVPGAVTEGAAALLRLAAEGKTVRIDLIDGEDLDPREFTADSASDPSVFAGEYHFGDSEWESTLTLTVEGDAVTGELGYADPGEGSTPWIPRRTPLDGGKIRGAMLAAPGWEGVFVRHRGRRGIVILRAPTDRIAPIEFGRKLWVDQE